MIVSAAGWSAAAQVPEPSSRCVQNCGGGAPPAPAAGTPADANRKRARATELALDEGILYYDRRDWKNAIRAFEEALEHSPDDQYLEKWLTSARSQKAAADRGTAAKDGKPRAVPAVIPPPPRPGRRPPAAGGRPALGEAATTSGKG